MKNTSWDSLTSFFCRVAAFGCIFAAWPLDAVSADLPRTSLRDALVSDANSCRAAGAAEWSSAELFAWEQLCVGEDIDMDRAPGAKPVTSLDSLRADPNRYLSDRFFNAVLHQPRFKSQYSQLRIHVSHAHLEALHFRNVSINEVVVDNSLIDGELAFVGGEAKYSIQISNVRGAGALQLFDITGGELTLVNATFDELAMASSSFSSVNVIKPRLRKLRLQNSTFAGELNLQACDCTMIYINHVNGARASIEASESNWLALDSISFTTSLDVSVHKWTGRGIAFDTDAYKDMPTSAVFARVSAPKWKIDFETYPQYISVVEADVIAVNLGDHPLDFLPRLDTGISGYAPVFYAAAIKFYSDTGRGGLGRDIRMRQKDNERRRASGFDRMVLDISWAVIGYGFVIERGFLWIGLFVIIGYFVFKSGAAQVDRAHLPDSWFYFTIDAVIPLISLNKKYDEVSFRGWRQHYLYFMKALGAALAFLVLGFLKQSFIDSA